MQMQMRIRMEKIRIRDKHPGSATMHSESENLPDLGLLSRSEHTAPAKPRMFQITVDQALI
jgi:hypothetical protein